MSKSKRKTFLFQDDIQNKINIIKDNMGFWDDSNAVRYAISFTANKIQPNYVVKRKQSIEETPEDKVQRDVETKDKREKKRKEMERAEKLRIMEQLEGELDPATDMVEFKNYTYINDNIPPAVGVRKVALMDLKEDFIGLQYRKATKEKIKSLIDNK